MYSIIQNFQSFLYEVGYSGSIQKMLPVLVREFIQQQNITGISCVDQQAVTSFYEYLQTRPLKQRSGGLSEMMISHYVYALRTFFGWLEITGQSDYNPISGLKFRRPKQNVREPLSTEEIKSLFASVSTLQERAVLHLFYSCGLRRSEGEALNINDIHFKNQLLYVRSGKGAKRRVVPLTAKVSEELEAYYLQHRCGIASKKARDEDAFILNRIGFRMSGNSYNKILKTLTGRAALHKEITLHHLRHSIATHLLQSGMSFEYVRDFLGHRFLESTQVYAKALAAQLKLL